MQSRVNDSAFADAITRLSRSGVRTIYDAGDICHESRHHGYDILA